MPRHTDITPATATPACTCLRLRKASRRVTQIYDQALDAHGLTVTQYGLLGYLKALDGIALGELAERLVMDPTTLTRTLRPMEKQGWVASTPDKDDARTRRVHITATGLATYRSAEPAWRKAQEKIATALGESDHKALARTIDHLLTALAT